MTTYTALEPWLVQATCRLSAASAAQVRAEIQRHYEAASEAAQLGGAVSEEASRVAIASLGDAKAANREYRKVLLTKSEAQILDQMSWKAPVPCSRPWLQPALVLMTAAGFCASAVFFSPLLLAAAFGLALFSTAIFLPVHTLVRGRLFRAVRWIWLAAVLVVASGSDSRNYVWLLPCMWPIVSTELTLAAVRRKLPVAAWPKRLYL